MVTTVSNRQDLETRIRELKQLQAVQKAGFRTTAVSIMDSINPSTIVQHILKDMVQSPEIRSTALNAAIGLGAGFLGKRLIVGDSKNLFKKITGSVVQLVVADFVRKKIPVAHGSDQPDQEESE